MKFNKKWLWLVIPLLIFSLCWINSSSVSTVLLAIKGTMIDGNLIKFSGTAGIGEDVGLSALNVKYGKFDATSAPTINDDVSLGYTVGSRWCDITNDKEYVCLDNTDGVAVWTETTGAGGGGGEVNTASNVGTGAEIFKQKSTYDLEFRKIEAGSSKIDISWYTEGEAVSQYPPAQSDTYVKATTCISMESQAPYFATDPTLSLIGNGSYTSWLSTEAGRVDQRFHIDLGSAKVINKIYYENNHQTGDTTNSGVNNFTFWGSNTGAGSFDDLVYANDEGWTELTCSQNTFDQHVALNQADPKYIIVTNTTAYRYYAFKFADNYGSGYYMGVFRIELQYFGTNYKDQIEIDVDAQKVLDALSPISPIYGGTGKANNVASTLTISGNFATTLTVTAATGVTFPTSGTLYGTKASSITSANLLSSITNETGIGLIVFGTSPVLITPTGVLCLLSTTTVSFAADADTTLYTVPAGKRCVLHSAIVVAAADAGATTTVSIGADGTETDFIPANTLSNLDTQYDSVILQPIPNVVPLKTKSYAAATVIQAQVASQSGAAGNKIYLFGILY